MFVSYKSILILYICDCSIILFLTMKSPTFNSDWKFNADVWLSFTSSSSEQHLNTNEITSTFLNNLSSTLQFPPILTLLTLPTIPPISKLFPVPSIIDTYVVASFYFPSSSDGGSLLAEGVSLSIEKVFLLPEENLLCINLQTIYYLIQQQRINIDLLALATIPIGLFSHRITTILSLIRVVLIYFILFVLLFVQIKLILDEMTIPNVYHMHPVTKKI